MYRTAPFSTSLNDP